MHVGCHVGEKVVNTSRILVCVIPLFLLLVKNESHHAVPSFTRRGRRTSIHLLHLNTWRAVTQPTTGNGPCGTKTHMVATKIPLSVFLAAFNQQPYVSRMRWSQKSMWISAPMESLLKESTEMMTYPKQLKSGQTHVSCIQQSRPLTCPAES